MCLNPQKPRTSVKKIHQPTLEGVVSGVDLPGVVDKQPGLPDQDQRNLWQRPFHRLFQTRAPGSASVIFPAAFPGVLCCRQAGLVALSHGTPHGTRSFWSRKILQRCRKR